MTPFLLSGFYFFYFALIAVHVIFLPKVLNLIGYSFIELSIIMAAAPLIRFLSPFLFVKYIKLTRTVFITALFLGIGASLMVYVTIDDFWPIFFVALVLGFSLSLVLPYVELIALEHIPKERYGKVRLYGSVGFIVVSLVLVEFITNPYNAIHFLVMTTVMIALFGYLLVTVVHKEVHSDQDDAQGGLTLFMRDKNLWISLFLMQLAFMPFYNFFFIHETAHGLSNQTTIYLWTLGVICEIGMLYYQGPLFHRFHMIDLLMVSTMITVVRWFMLFAFPENVALLAIAQAMHAFSFGLYHSAAIRYLYTIYENKKLAQQFFAGIAYGFGGLVGTVIAGLWYDFSAQSVYLYASAMTLIAWWLMLRHKRGERQGH